MQPSQVLSGKFWRFQRGMQFRRRMRNAKLVAAGVLIRPLEIGGCRDPRAWANLAQLLECSAKDAETWNRRDPSAD
jgi:hypothetical protein